jgi:hypothetical protein
MADTRQFEKLRAALGPAADCPPFEQLTRALDYEPGDARRSDAEEHIAGCVHCRDEVALMREFLDVRLRPEEDRDVRWVVRKLEKQEVAPRPRRSFAFFFGMRALAAAACVVLVVGGALYMRRTPGPPSVNGIGEGAMRSQAIGLISPVGDVAARPAEFRWRAVPGAARYQVRLMEVDGREVWSGETADTSIAAPTTPIAPGTTLLWEVRAMDGSGKVIATSATSTFRVSPGTR